MQRNDLCMQSRWHHPLPCPSGSFLVANSFPSFAVECNIASLAPQSSYFDSLHILEHGHSHTDRCTVVQLMDLMAKGGNKIEEGTSACLMKLHLQVFRNAMQSSLLPTPPRPAPPLPVPPHTTIRDLNPRRKLLWTEPSSGSLGLLSDTVELWLAGGQHRGCPRCV